MALKTLPANKGRGLLGLFGIVCASAGAGSMWGTPAFFIAFGGIVTVCCTIDEVVERATLIKRTAGDE